MSQAARLAKGSSPKSRRKTSKRGPNCLLDLLGAADRQKILNEQPDEKGSYRFINLAHPVGIRVTGYGFYDAAHSSRSWKASQGGRCHFTPEEVHKRGNSHGTCAVAT